MGFQKLDALVLEQLRKRVADTAAEALGAMGPESWMPKYCRRTNWGKERSKLTSDLGSIYLRQGRLDKAEEQILHTVDANRETIQTLQEERLLYELSQQPFSFIQQAPTVLLAVLGIVFGGTLVRIFAIGVLGLEGCFALRAPPQKR